jgi:hypothetical protein
MRTRLSLLLLLIAITAAYAQPDQRIAKSPKVNYDWQPGFISITEVTGGIGLGDTGSELSRNFFGITTVAGYQFSRNIKAGAGVGVQVHDDGTLFPLFLDFRLNMNSQEIVPFLSGAGGIMLNFNDIIEETRVFINPMAGVRFVAANRTAISFSTGLLVSTGGRAERKSYLNFKLGVELKFRN